MSRVEILYDDAVLSLGVLRNLVVPIWRDAPGVAQVRAMGRAIGGAASRYGHSFGVLNGVVSGTPAFTDEARAELEIIMRDERLYGCGAAHVISVTGFKGVATRAFLSTIFLVSRSTSMNRVFDEPEAASAWLAPRLAAGGAAVTTTEILGAHAEVVGVGGAARAARY